MSSLSFLIATAILPTTIGFRIEMSNIALLQESLVSASQEQRIYLAQGNSQMKTSPRKPIDLIFNIFTALNEKSFFSDSFYRDSDLEEFFGATSVRWKSGSNTSERRWADVLDFKNIIEPVMVNGYTQDGIACFFRLTEDKTENKLSFILSVNFYQIDNSIKFDDITKIFGNNCSNFPYFPIPQGMVLKPASDIHGNQRIKYDLKQYKSGNIIFEFSEIGTLKSINLYAEDN